MTPSPPAKRFNWSNLGIRVLSTIVLAPAALFVLLLDGAWGSRLRLVLISAVAALLAIEWAMMSARQAPGRIALAVTAAVLAAAFTADFDHYRIAWLVLVLCAGAAAPDRPRCRRAAGRRRLRGPVHRGAVACADVAPRLRFGVGTARAGR